MTTSAVRLILPPGIHVITIQGSIPLFSAKTQLCLRVGIESHLEFYSRERLWDVLFSMDLILCVLKFFFTFPSPWGWIYEVVTNGFFLVWLIYEWLIRKQFYRLKCYDTLPAAPASESI